MLIRSVNQFRYKDFHFADSSLRPGLLTTPTRGQNSLLAKFLRFHLIPLISAEPPLLRKAFCPRSLPLTGRRRRRQGTIPHRLPRRAPLLGALLTPPRESGGADRQLRHPRHAFPPPPAGAARGQQGGGGGGAWPGMPYGRRRVDAPLARCGYRLLPIKAKEPGASRDGASCYGAGKGCEAGSGRCFRPPLLLLGKRESNVVLRWEGPVCAPSQRCSLADARPVLASRYVLFQEQRTLTFQQ